MKFEMHDTCIFESHYRKNNIKNNFILLFKN